MSRANAVEIMRGGKHQCADDCKGTIRGQAQLGVRHRGADNQQGHAQNASGYDAKIAMAAKPEPKGKNTERQHNDEHLQVQVSLGKAGEQRQPCYQQWQRKTMHEAQGRQRDRGAIQPVCGLSHTIIRRQMPLCYQSNG